MTNPTSLDQVQSFVYLLDSQPYSNSTISTIKNSPVQLIISGLGMIGEVGTRNQLDPNHTKIVLGYTDLGGTTPQGHPELFSNNYPPSWFGGTEPGYPGPFYSVQYWNPIWEKAIFSDIDKVIKDGFDGVFLDGSASYADWIAGNKVGNPIIPNAVQLSAKLISDVILYIQNLHLNKQFYIIVNMPGDIAKQYPSSLNGISGIFQELVYYISSSTDYTIPIYTGSGSASYFNGTLNPLYKSFNIPLFGNDYPSLTNPTADLASFSLYDQSGWIPSINTPDPSPAVLLSGPYMAIAVPNNTVVNGASDLENYLGGGIVTNVTINGGNKTDYIIGGPGLNIISAQGGNDIIYAHPDCNGYKNTLAITYVATNNNGSLPELDILLNNQNSYAFKKIQSSPDVSMTGTLYIDLSNIGNVKSIKLSATGLSYQDQDHYSNIRINSIYLDSMSLPLQSAQWSNNVSVPGLLNNNDTAIYQPGSFGSPPLVTQNTSDTIDGGSGIDTVVYHSSENNYQIFLAQNGQISIVSLATYEGPDTLLNVERLKFSDANVAFDINGNAGEAYRLYQAAFDRTPDSGGLGYWIAQLDKGSTLKSVADSFISSAEFQKLYGSLPSNASFVDSLYHNVLHRAGEKGGVDYWNGVLNSGTSRADVLAGFSESTENKAGVIGSIQSGIHYTEWTG